MPSAKAECGGPRRVKCHSKRSVSRGVAVYSGEGEEDSSAASFTGCGEAVWSVAGQKRERMGPDLQMRRIVGDLELNLGVAMMAAIECAIEGTSAREQ